MTAPWNEATLQTLLSNYNLEDTFNADEFGLFYQCLPSKTYHLSGEKCSGGKSSKVRLIGMAAASATGEKLETFGIGKSKKPRRFKNVKQLPCRYRAQKKSWMIGVLFEEWVRKLDASFRAQSRKVALLIDNCPAHPEIKNPTNINLIFLPPNTTSVLQPMDQGVIRSLKVHYRKKVVRLCIKAVESNKPLPKISILQAIKHLVSSWNAVSKETIVNCFKKSNISQTNRQQWTMMTIHSKVCRRISRNCMSWIMMSFNQIYQLNHLLIWIVKLSDQLLSLMMMISSPKLLKGRMKRAKMIKMMKKVQPTNASFN